MVRRLLLISSSTCFGSGWLDHAIEAIGDLLRPGQRVAFVPYAVFDRRTYGERFRARMAEIGVTSTTVTPDAAGRRVLEDTPAVFVGGGNTFRLLRTLQQTGQLDQIRERALAGMAYLGASAGTNVAAPTIMTTNDMPIVELTSLRAMGLLPFQINPHYLDPDPHSTHQGETREQRIREFHEENETPVVGLREGSWIRVEGESATLVGTAGARIFRKGEPPEERPPGASLDDLLR